MEKQLFILSGVIWVFFVTIEAGQFYKFENGNQYYIENNTQFQWYDALYECAYRNMRLVTPDTMIKQLEIVKIFDSFTFGYMVWTSGHEVKNNMYVWSTTGNKLNYKNWKQGEPLRDGSRSHCIGMSRYGNHYWLSYECSTTLMYVICEEIPLITVIKQELDALKKLQDTCDTNETTTKVDPETVQNPDLDLLKRLYKNETDFLLTELKKFYEIQLDLLKKSHANEINQKARELTALRNDYEEQVKHLNKFHERETNLLAKEKNYFKNFYELLSNRSSAMKNYQVIFNTQRNPN